MGFSLAVVHVSWNGRYLSGLLMNRRGKKNLHNHRLPFFDGERERDEGFTWCYTSFLRGKRAARSLPTTSWCCLWGFFCFPVQFCARTNRHQLKDPLRFFLLFFPPPTPWSCFPGSLSHVLGVPRERGEGGTALGILLFFFFFSPVLLLSQASYLWSQGRKWRGWEVRGAWGVLRTSLPKACCDSPGVCTKAEEFAYA